MDIAGNLKTIVDRQKNIAVDLEAGYQALKDSDFVTENKALKAEIDKLRADLEQASANIENLATENSSLKNSLYEQIYSEKIKILNSTADKLDIYFRSNVNGELNKLAAMENNAKARINSIRETLANNNIEARAEIDTKLAELSELLDVKLSEARAKAAGSSALSQEERDQIEALKNENLTDEQIRAITKKNNFEKFVGLNVLNVIGVFLLVVGAITAIRYTYLKLTDLWKCVMIFTLGGIMLAAGELMNRKKPNVFSLGISAGGVAILYVALAASYFALHILEMYPAIVICVLLTTGAFVLSTRYSSQVIASFALIGGYLPIFSLGSDIAFYYGAMVYFVILNLFALLFSWNRKWRVTAFIGLSLNIIATAFICFGVSALDAGTEILFRKFILIFYAFFAFSIYTAIPVVSTWRTRASFRKSDVVLLAINTVFSSFIMYTLFYGYMLNDYLGLLTAVFAAVYLFLGRFSARKFTEDARYATALFYLTGLAFVVLIIPFQFGRVWLSLGWLAEGVLLAVYGILKNDKRFRIAGLIISGLCLYAFLVFDLLWVWRYLFPWKYLAITIGSLLILGAYMYKKNMSGGFVSVYKYFALINAWIYVLYIINKANAMLSDYYLIAAACITTTFCIAYIIPRIKILSCTGLKILSIVFYGIGIIWLFVINQINTPFSLNTRHAAVEPGIFAAGTVILAVLGILSVLALADLIKLIINGKNRGAEWIPLIVSAYFILILTQNLITQYNLSFSSMVLSLIYVLTALVWIVFGFMRRFVFIRRFGLGLAIFAVIKLFLVDLQTLTEAYRIVSYFALGITLLAISFVYQYFSKKLNGMQEHFPQ